MEMIEGTLNPALANSAFECKVGFCEVEMIAEDFNHQRDVTDVPAARNILSRLGLDGTDGFTAITSHVG